MKIRNFIFGLIAVAGVGAFQNCEGLKFTEMPTEPRVCDMGCGCGIQTLSYFVGQGPLIDELGKMFVNDYDVLPLCASVAARAPKAFEQLLVGLAKGASAKACSRVLTRISYEIQADGRVLYLESGSDPDEILGKSEVVGADAKSFSFRNASEPFDRYAVDKTHVYFRGQVIPNADPATFKVRQSLAATDAHGSYFGSTRVERAELCRIINDEAFVKTASQVFYSGVLTAIDPGTVSFLRGPYLRDRQAIYCMDRRDGARLVRLDVDPEKFAYDSRSGRWGDDTRRFNGCVPL